jgi:spermidine synthase
MLRSATQLWYAEAGTPNERHHFAVKRVLYSRETPFQTCAILDTYQYGKMLVIDGRTQSAEADEYIYHESLVHPALMAHPAPQRVLIIGGGEGATLREVLRHRSIERVVMVDIDRELVEQCEKLLPEWHRGAFRDPRVELVFSDGQAFIADHHDRFDVVILDVCDALEDGPALPLYTEAFYRRAKSRLTESGLLVVQAMELSGVEHADHVTVHRTLRPLFHHVSSYATFIPSFWSSWGFIVAGDTINVGGFLAAAVDERLEQRGLAAALAYYDGHAHVHMFELPRDVRRILNEGMASSG